MWCVLCSRRTKRKTWEEWNILCGKCKSLSPSEIDNLYWLQEKFTEKCVLSPVAARFYKYCSLRRYREVIRSGVLGHHLVLDIGCGVGQGAGYFLESGRYVGVEVEHSTVLKAKETHPSASFVQADAAMLPFHDRSVPAVLALEVIEHLPPEDAWNLAREVRRVLRPGGRLFLSTPDGRSSLAKRLIGSYTAAAHVREYTPKEIREMFTTTGFQLIEERALSMPQFPCGVIGATALQVIAEYPESYPAIAIFTRMLGYRTRLFIWRVKGNL
nr:class I SAM-dependent methyltransferase [Desulfobacterales bacterium]